jgi:hypothetical protein
MNEGSSTMMMLQLLYYYRLPVLISQKGKAAKNLRSLLTLIERALVLLAVQRYI